MQSCKMGAKASVDEKPPPQQLQREKLHHVRIVVAQCAGSCLADSLINKFLINEYRESYPSNIKDMFQIERRIIDDEIVELQIMKLSAFYRRLLLNYVLGDNAGLMVLYNVQDKEAFETAQEVVCEVL